jgi:hypothetical protein
MLKKNYLINFDMTTKREVKKRLFTLSTNYLPHSYTYNMYNRLKPCLIGYSNIIVRRLN